MYLRLTCKITIADSYVLRGVHQIEIKRSIYQSIDTAKVVLPLSIVMRNNDMLQRIRLADKINEGDSIRLEFGYNDNNRLEFEGYIRRINYAQPLELECENEMYKLRKALFKKSFRSVSLKELLQFVLDGLEEMQGVRFTLYDQVPQMMFANFVMREASGIAILQELKEKYGVTCYLTTINGIKTLYAGLAYSLKKGSVKHVIDRNVINTSNLKYERKGDKKYRVKVTVFHRNGTNQSWEFGDKDGELRSIQRVGTYTEKDIEQMAKAEMDKFKAEGYQGDFETFLIPYCEPGYVTILSNPQFPDRDGNYYVSAVTTVFGIDGAKRKPELSIKTSV